jgi:secreted trypsin-like serine protease
MKMYSEVVFLLLVLLISPLFPAGNTEASPMDMGGSARIIGGNESDEPYPWMVSIQANGHFCAGALIGNNWVITAAHCLVDMDSDRLNLMIGASDLVSLEGAEFRTASWFKLHHNYIVDRFYNDIAIIKLNMPSSKTPIKILDQGSQNSLLQDEQLRVLGWGLTKEGDQTSISTKLRQVDVSFQSDDVCENTYGSFGVSDYWDTSFCAGEKEGGKDACQGDSGGPVIVMANNQWALVGIVSWGIGCARAGEFGAYTEVAEFKNWIEQRRDGVTILGPEKIGYVAEGRSSPQAYSIINYGTDNAAVLNKFIRQSSSNIFSIDESNWLLDNGIPARYECSFVVNASGNQVGEFDASLEINIAGNTVYHPLNIKVLNSVSASSLDVDWPFYSGQSGISDYVSEWQESFVKNHQNGNGSVFKSDNIGNGQNSVLLTYLNGSNAEETHYLKFDANVHSKLDGYSLDSLHLYVNHQQINLKKLIALEEQSSWNSYSVELPKDINHVLYAFDKNHKKSSGTNSAFLDNFRVCLAPDNETSCSTASAYANSDDLSQLDNPPPDANWQTVCQSLNYEENPIEYASRSVSDAVYIDGRSSGLGVGGGGLFWLLWLSTLVLPMKFGIFYSKLESKSQT